MAYFIEDPRAWRVSKSGFSIKTGWADEKKVIASYPGAVHPLDAARFNEWLENAERICELHNSTLSREDSVHHHVTCNYPRGPLGGPGCVCVVVNKHDVERDALRLDSAESLLREIVRMEGLHARPLAPGSFGERVLQYLGVVETHTHKWVAVNRDMQVCECGAERIGRV